MIKDNPTREEFLHIIEKIKEERQNEIGKIIDSYNRRIKYVQGLFDNLYGDPKVKCPFCGMKMLPGIGCWCHELDGWAVRCYQKSMENPYDKKEMNEVREMHMYLPWEE